MRLPQRQRARPVLPQTTALRAGEPEDRARRAHCHEPRNHPQAPRQNHVPLVRRLDDNVGDLALVGHLAVIHPVGDVVGRTSHYNDRGRVGQRGEPGCCVQEPNSGNPVGGVVPVVEVVVLVEVLPVLTCIMAIRPVLILLVVNELLAVLLPVGDIVSTVAPEIGPVPLAVSALVTAFPATGIPVIGPLPAFVPTARPSVTASGTAIRLPGRATPGRIARPEASRFPISAVRPLLTLSAQAAATVPRGSTAGPLGGPAPGTSTQ